MVKDFFDVYEEFVKMCIAANESSTGGHRGCNSKLQSSSDN